MPSAAGLALLTLVWGATPQAHAAAPKWPAAINFITVDFPGFATATAPIGIGERGEFGGYYDDGSGNIHGYVLKRHTFVPIDFPGATSTWLTAVTDRGDFYGTYLDASGFQHGFRLSREKFTSIDVPGAVQTTGIDFDLGSGLGTAAFGASNAGVNVGQYADSSGVSHGWTLKRGQFATLDAPAASLSAGGGTVCRDVNQHSDIVGTYVSASTPPKHGFLIHKGIMSTIDVPGAGGSLGTQCNGINTHGEIVGVYSDTADVRHCFVRTAGQFVTFDYPGAVSSECYLINNLRDITGQYTDSGGIIHGFLATKRKSPRIP